MLSEIPTFIYIGADRCGSTWMLRALAKHPNVLIPEVGNPFFFDRYYDRGWEWYVKLFGTPSEQVLAAGEFSHDYLFSPIAARRIRERLPRVKLLVSIRQPLDKAFSAHWLANSAGELKTDFDTALLTSGVILEQALYHRLLTPYFELFPRDQIKVMMFDDLGRRPRWFMSEVCEFIGVPFVETIPYDTVFNARAWPRTKWLGLFAKALSNTARTLHAESLLGLKHDPRVRAIFYRKEGQDRIEPSIKRSTFEKVRPIVDEQIVKLCELTGQDFKPWLEHERYIQIH